jgi:hypothetical protein
VWRPVWRSVDHPHRDRRDDDRPEGSSLLVVVVPCDLPTAAVAVEHQHRRGPTDTATPLGSDDEELGDLAERDRSLPLGSRRCEPGQGPSVADEAHLF